MYMNTQACDALFKLCVTPCMKVRRQLVELVLSHHVESRAGAQVSKLLGKHFYLLNCPGL